MAVRGRRWMLGCAVVVVKGLGSGGCALAADDDALDQSARRQEALEALRDLGQAKTDEEFDRALERFNQKAGEEQHGAAIGPARW